MNRPSPEDMKAMWVMEYVEELEKENKLLEYAIKELMVQCDIKYFRFRDKEFYKQEFTLNFSSKN